MHKLGGRKLMLGAGVLLLGAAIDLGTAKGLSEHLLYLLTFISSGFFLGNGIEHMSISLRRRRSRSTPQAQDSIPVAEVNHAVQVLLDQNNQINESLGALSKSMEALMKTLGGLANRRPAR